MVEFAPLRDGKLLVASADKEGFVSLWDVDRHHVRSSSVHPLHPPPPLPVVAGLRGEYFVPFERMQLQQNCRVCRGQHALQMFCLAFSVRYAHAVLVTQISNLALVSFALSPSLFSRPMLLDNALPIPHPACLCFGVSLWGAASSSGRLAPGFVQGEHEDDGVVYFMPHRQYVSGMAWRQGGASLLTCSYDSTIRSLPQQPASSQLPYARASLTALGPWVPSCSLISLPMIASLFCRSRSPFLPRATLALPRFELHFPSRLTHSPGSGVVLLPSFCLHMQ